MPTPSPRTPVLPARGFYAVVAALSADIQDGELVYIKDQNTLYVKESGALVPILGSGAVATNSVRAGDNVSKLANDVGYITLADVPEDRVLSVNGELGSVVLDADDIPTTGTINKFTTQDDIDKLAGIQPGAEINVNADWNATEGDAQILNKPTLYTDEQAQDAAGGLFEHSNHDGISASYNDAANQVVLSVTGVKSTSFPPINSTDPGVPGEIRFDNQHIYVCIAEDLWKRTALLAF